MKIKRIYDKYDNDLYKFRISAIVECGGAPKHVKMTSHYDNVYKVLSDHGVKRIEDVYRFTDGKWKNTDFDFIDAHYSDDGCITNISGAKQYKNWMRGAIYHFGLKAYSSKYPSVLFQPDGHLDRLVEYAKEKNLNGIFISIFPHNSRLEALCSKLRFNTGIPTTGNIDLIRQLTYRGTHVLNGVDQQFFVVELNNSIFKITDIL